MTGIPPARAGVPKIEVTFEIDANGMLSVSAVDLASGRSESAKITNQENRLSAQDIERMIADAEKYAQKDEEFRIRVDARSRLEVRSPNPLAPKTRTDPRQTQVNGVRRMVDDYKNLAAEDKKALLKAADEASAWLGYVSNLKFVLVTDLT